MLSTHEAREVETVGDATLGSEINHCVHHIAAACHAEAHVACTLQHHVGSLNEVLWTFLHCDTSEEGYDLLLTCMVWARDVLQLLTQWVNGVVHCEALARILMILMDNGLTCEFRHAHDAVGVVHTVLLDGVNRGVHLTA